MAGLINIDVGSMAKGITDLLQAKLKTPLDPNKMAEIEAEISTLIITKAGESDAGQVSQNLVDAQSGNGFRANWRPACAWLCVWGLAWSTIVKSTIEWVAVLAGQAVILPAFDTNVLTTMLIGLLGLGAMRTVEKMKGVG